MTDQKIDTAKAQSAISEVADRIQKTQACLDDGSRRNEALSSRIDEMSERINAAHCRLESVGSRLDQEASQQQNSSRDAQETASQFRQDIWNLTQCIAEVQVDLQLRDQKISDLEEMIFHNGVTMERGLQECREPSGAKTLFLRVFVLSMLKRVKQHTLPGFYTHTLKTCHVASRDLPQT